MIVVKKKENVGTDTVYLELYCDSIEELGTSSIPGVDNNAKIQASSTAYDSDGKKAIFTSAGTWKELP